MKTTLICTFSCIIFLSHSLFGQSMMSEPEKIADSIYYNHDDHTSAEEFKEALELYNNALSSVENTQEKEY